jgi:hypothetical protein
MMIKFNFITSHRNKEPGKSFSMETRLGAGLPENVGSIPDGSGDMSLYHRVQTDSGTYPALWPVGAGSLSPGIKRLVCDTNHKLPSSAEV